jgi:hypothetical protein
MSATAITKTVVTRNAATAVPSAATVAKTDGALVTFDKDDQKILLLLKNNITNVTHTAVIKAGNGLQGVSDLEVTLAASSEACVVVESGRFVNVSGDDKGKVNIVSKDTVTGTQIEVRAVVLP